MSKDFAFKNTIPVAPLKICALESCREFAEKVNKHIVTFRRRRHRRAAEPPGQHRIPGI